MHWHLNWMLNFDSKCVFEHIVCKVSPIFFRPQCIWIIVILLASVFGTQWSLLLYSHTDIIKIRRYIRCYGVIYSDSLELSTGASLYGVSVVIIQTLLFHFYGYLKSNCEMAIMAIYYFHGRTCQPSAHIVMAMLSWTIGRMQENSAQITMNHMWWLDCNMDKNEYVWV